MLFPHGQLQQHSPSGRLDDGGTLLAVVGLSTAVPIHQARTVSGERTGVSSPRFSRSVLPRYSVG
jgi:hypothetical protein